MSDSSQPKNLYNDLIIDGKSIEDILKDCTIDLGATGASASDVYISTSAGNYNYSSDYTNISTITLSPSPSTYTMNTLSTTDTITISNLDTSAFTLNLPQEWVDSFPAWDRVKDMCEHYPGLKVAFENFKVFYEMIKDDYDNPTPKK
jgi:hypothetical protein